MLWYEDFTLLYENGRYLEFWPTDDMSYDEKVNAISRLIIISSVLISVYKKNKNALIAGIVTLIAMYTLLRSKKTKVCENPIRKVKVLEGSRTSNCRNPTSMNPFSNYLVGNTNDMTSACEYDEVKNEIEHEFNKGQYKDDFDVFDRKNSRRQFYSMPNTKVANDQTEYAKWLYGSNKVCKDDYKICRGDEAFR